MSKSMVRSVKNVTKGYSSVQVKVRNGQCPLLRRNAPRKVAYKSRSNQQ